MNTKLGLKIFSAAACLAILGGCMSTSQDESRGSDASVTPQATRILNAASAGISAKTSVDIGSDQLADIMDQIGCPKLGDLFRDLSDIQSLTKVQASQSLPQSFESVFSCFGISSLTSNEDFGKVEESFGDFESLIDCVCGSKALSNLIAGQWTLYSAANSSVTGGGFDASASNAGGSGFDAANSNAGGSGFDASASNAGGTGFSAE